jgi:hypothetical protein
VLVTNDSLCIYDEFKNIFFTAVNQKYFGRNESLSVTLKSTEIQGLHYRI